MAGPFGRSRKKDDDQDKRKLNKESLSRLFGILKYMKPYLGVFSIGLVALLITSVAFMAIPQMFGDMLDAALPDSDPKFKLIEGGTNAILIGLLIIFVVQAVFSFLRVYTFTYTSEKSMADVREATYKRLLVLPMGFFDKNRVGELSSRIMSDITQLQGLLSTTIAELLRQVIILSVGLVILFLKSAYLTGFMLAVVPVIMIIAAVIGRSIRKLSRKTQDQLADSNVVVEETLQSVSTVKAYSNENYEINRYRLNLNDVVKQALKTSVFRSLFISFILFGTFAAIGLVLWQAAKQVETGEISPGELISFFVYTIFIGGSVAGLGDLFSQVQKALGASDRVLEILDEEAEGDPAKSSEKLDIRGDIRYENVKFAYPTREDIEVLKGISLYANSGEKIALAGSSGAGKSTIIQLLLRFYEVQEGQITVDGKPMRELDLYQLRQHIGIVPQEVILFGGSIRENIAYGNPGATDEAIREAAEQANALEFIEGFPEGLDTKVGDRGVKLSGGQRQRIAIARAILKNPKILILDEATSSLDAESEKLVQDALDKLMEGRTTIIIAHRLATIRKVNRIYVLSHGEIVEQGTHEELSVKEGGVYANLVKLQNLVEN